MLGNTSPKALELQTNLLILALILILNLSLRFIDAYWAKGNLNKQYGIIPRRQFSLARIFLSNFLHGDRSHLFGNMPLLLTLGGMAMFPDRQLFWLATFIIIIVIGLGIWLFGRPPSHIGASGLLLGYFSYLLMRGVLEWEPFLIFITLFVLGLYRRLFGWVVFIGGRISTEGHFFGFLGGILAAWFIAWLKATYSL
ncbi:MAG: rhomboid family intramembrane serine protease [Ardenticatenaceae bacterium]|nr:rhomboid family intramembrane serine protease [Ardenticatenaceae bacterium]